MDKRIFLFLLLGMFMISTVSAFYVTDVEGIDKAKWYGDHEGIDKAKWYGDHYYGDVLIQERAWYDPFGWVVEKTVLKTEIIDHTPECLSYCYTVGETIIFEDGHYLFEDIKTQNKEEKQVFLDLGIYIWQNVTETWKEQVYDKDNKTEWKDHESTTEKWILYDNSKLTKGTYRWKVETKNKPSKESVDWIPTLLGEEIKEWAWWDALSGDYEVFETDGTFTVPSGVTNVSVLIVAGGGSGASGGGNDGEGGGGAGGLIFNHSYTVTPSDNIAVTVGDGGASIPSGTNSDGNDGGNSVFGTLTAIGGGGGAYGTTSNGHDGGSGGGGYGDNSASLGGSGTVGQGNDGGDGFASGTTTQRAGGGGGGAGAVGNDGASSDGGDGGAGSTYYGETFACGGGGGANAGSGSQGYGGCATAGDGGYGSTGGPTSATANYGGGGGGQGGGSYNSGAGGSGIVFVRYVIPTPIITTHYPSNNSNFSTNAIITNATIYGNAGIDNVTFFVDAVLNQTNSSGQNNTVYTFDVDLSDGTHTLQIRATNNYTQTTNGDLIYVNIDTTAPSIYEINNLTDLTTWNLPINSTWNYTVYDTNIDSCYYNTTDNTTYKVVTCNSSITDLQWATGGSKTVQYCVNDTFGLETCDQKSIDIFYVQEDWADTPDPIVEGFDATFNLTVNMTSIPTTTAYLVLNNTIYWPTTTTPSTNGYYFERTITIPDNYGNTTGLLQDYYWNYTINGVTTNKSTSTDNITVYELAIDDCTTYGTKILEFDLNDEETNILVNGSAGSGIEISLDLVDLSNGLTTLSYNNTWTNVNQSEVCIPNEVLNNTEWEINMTVGFDSTDRVWEFYYLDKGVLNSTLIFDAQTDSTIDLMDLATVDSTSFLFNYFDQDGLPVNEAIVHVFRKYIGEGTFREVERAKADQNGNTIVHLVEEDVIYYFKITKFGDLLYTSSTYTALCQATPCTIQIEASGDGAEFRDDWDLVDGGAYDVTSDVTTRTASLEFSSTDASTWNFTVYKYNSDGSYSSINTTSATGTSGTETLSIPLSAGNVSFFATVHKDDTFINSEWIDFEGNPQDNFGTTLSLLIAGLIILSLGLMSVTEGGVVIVWVMLGVILSGFLGLITTELSTGVNIVVYLVLAGGLLLWKLTRRRD